jgi:hypothetical protein
MSIDKHQELVEKADETGFWLEMPADSGIVQSKKLEIC